jgi:membrane-anchored mycosin MYCP
MYHTAAPPLRIAEGRDCPAGGIMATYRGRVETFHDDQLIVPIPDLPVTKKALADLGVRWPRKGIDPSVPLGLARIHGLSGVREAVDMLMQDPDIGGDLQRFREYQIDVRDGQKAAGLEILVKGLHLQFAQKFPGWKVTIGKNYGPSVVKGRAADPHWFGGQGNPGKTTAKLTLPRTEHGRGVRVGVLDTRLFPAKILAGHYIARPSDVLDPGQPEFTMFDGHCAFVSSCILRQAPAAELHVYYMLDSEGDGSAWDAAKAMAQMAHDGLDVVNLSFGGFLTDDNTAPMVLDTAVKRFSPETVVVAAAANNGDETELTGEMNGIQPNSASYPAALPDVVGVGSLDQQGKLAAFTPSPAPWISLLAPGVGIIGAYVQGNVTLETTDKGGHPTTTSVLFNGKAKWEGNSFAAAAVTGGIAAGTLPGRRSPREVLEGLLQSKPGSDIVPNPAQEAP